MTAYTYPPVLLTDEDLANERVPGYVPSFMQRVQHVLDGYANQQTDRVLAIGVNGEMTDRVLRGSDLTATITLAKQHGRSRDVLDAIRDRIEEAVLDTDDGGDFLYDQPAAALDRIWALLNSEVIQ